MIILLLFLQEIQNSMERAYDYKSKVFFNDLGDFKKIGKKVSINAIKKLNSKKLKHVKAM